ncbi:MAG: hypothetical protein KatS3mg131_0736 [Candidatus Tectimicrobiota bacterium]|nr:MAG: hypothetical protein KatS3mg131_0736 [Candidatus Tectomicrobia bacterium]
MHAFPRRTSSPLEERLLGTVAGAAPDERLELLWRREDGTSQLVLRVSRWGTGVGWYPQRTLPLDPQQLQPLLALLQKASGLLRPGKGKLLPLRHSG